MNKHNRPTIIFDVDGVLLDWFGSFKQWMQGLGVTVDLDVDTTWDMTNVFTGLKAEEITNRIIEFNSSEHFGHLDHWPGAMAAVMQLRNKYPDHIFSALTGAGTSPKTTRLRAASIEDFPIDEMFIVPLGESKTPWLARYPEGSVFIEDNAGHALDGVKMHMNAVLLDRPYNQDIPSDELDEAHNAGGVLYRADDWEHAVGIIGDLHQHLAHDFSLVIENDGSLVNSQTKG